MIKTLVCCLFIVSLSGTGCIVKKPRLENSEDARIRQPLFPTPGPAETSRIELREDLAAIESGDGELRGDLSSSRGASIVNLLEIAEMVGKSTGIVTTTRLTHATPAACYANTPERDWEADSDLPEEARAVGFLDIASQLIAFPYGNGIEVAMGGGRGTFRPCSSEDPEGAEDPDEEVYRKDSRDLTKEGLERFPNGAYVWVSMSWATPSPTCSLLAIDAGSAKRQDTGMLK